MTVWKFSFKFKAHNPSLILTRTTIISLFLSLLYSIGVPQPLIAQESRIEVVETQLKTLHGIDRLIALNELTRLYRSENNRKAIKYGKQAIALGENIFVSSNKEIDLDQKTLLLEAHVLLGLAFFDKENYFGSKDHLEAAQKLANELDDHEFDDEIDQKLGNIQARIESGEIKEGFISKALSDLKVGEAFNETSKDIAIKAELARAGMNENKAEFSKAIKHYEKAIELLRDKGDSKKITEIQIKIAVLLDSLNLNAEAQIFLDKAISEMESEGHSKYSSAAVDRPTSGRDTLKNVSEISLDSVRSQQNKLKALAENYANENDFEKSREYLQLYIDLSMKMETDSLNALTFNKRKESEIHSLKQQKQIADLKVNAVEQEKIETIKWRNTFIAIAALILLSALVIAYNYFSKRREHKKLTIAYRDLDKTRNKLVGAEKRITHLLSQQVSSDVAQQLLSEGSDTPAERRFVCIMFLDIRDFTPMAEKMTPEELIHFQNDLFGFMMDIVQKNNGNINQLLGDGFMATFGAPVSHKNDCQNAYNSAIEIIKEVADRNDAGMIKKTKIGIGLHAGHVVTGNVGTEARKQYSVTGNTVIIASRVEQLNKTYRSQFIITEEVYNELEKPHKMNQLFIEVKVKGRTHPVKILKIA